MDQEAIHQATEPTAPFSAPQDVVGACYHALGVDGGGLSAVETWGEDATSDWTPPYPMDMMPLGPCFGVDSGPKGLDLVGWTWGPDLGPD